MKKSLSYGNRIVGVTSLLWLAVLTFAVPAAGHEVSDLRRKADTGDAEACYELAVTYARGKGVSRDFGKASEFLYRAAHLGHPAAKKALDNPRLLLEPEVRPTSQGIPVGPSPSFQDRSPWLFPDSDRRFLTHDDLSRLSRDELWRARNEIFARRGYIFGTDKGKVFAQNLGTAYRGLESSQDRVYSTFNGYERQNISLIQQYERNR